MDVSAIIVVLVLTALSLAAIVGLEIYSRKASQKEPAADRTNSRAKSNDLRDRSREAAREEA